MLLKRNWFKDNRAGIHDVMGAWCRGHDQGQMAERDRKQLQDLR